MCFSDQSLELAEKLVAAAIDRGLHLTTAESCTGGLIAACLTAVPGTSAAFDCGFVTYANSAKIRILGVSEDLLNSVGAVSEEVACAMATGAIEAASADISVAVTGIAGPTGGTPSKPVGLVHIASARKDGRLLHERKVFPGDRVAVRRAAVESALALMLSQAETATT